MIIACELSEGSVVRVESRIYKVLEVESKAGAAKMSGVVRTKLVDMKSGRLWEPHFRPQERVEIVQLERRNLEFLYSDGELCIFMRPDTFDQISVPNVVIGPAAKFLQPGQELPVEFFGEEAIRAIAPSSASARISVTAPPARSQHDSNWKNATLDNGLRIRVPLFIGPGEVVRVDVNTGHYLERVHS